MSKSKIINLTPHTIKLYNEGGKLTLSVPPSGDVARCEVVRKKSGRLGEIPLFTTVFGEVVGLPDELPEDAFCFVVSGLVRSALPHREDLWQPGELLRDGQGRVIGCVGLSR